MADEQPQLSTIPGAVIGYRADGRPIRLIAGGAPADESSSSSGSSSAGGESSSSSAGGPSGDPGDLPDNIKAILAKERKARADAEKAARAAAKKIKDFEDRDKSEAQKALDRAEAAEKAATERAARVLRSEIKAAAAGKLADPADAYRFLDLEQLVDDDGEPDETKIADAIAQLVKDKPYLAKGATHPGDGDQGARGGGKSDEDKSIDDFVGQFSRSKK